MEEAIAKMVKAAQAKPGRKVASKGIPFAVSLEDRGSYKIWPSATGKGHGVASDSALWAVLTDDGFSEAVKILDRATAAPAAAGTDVGDLTAKVAELKKLLPGATDSELLAFLMKG